MNDFISCVSDTARGHARSGSRARPVKRVNQNSHEPGFVGADPVSTACTEDWEESPLGRFSTAVRGAFSSCGT